MKKWLPLITGLVTGLAAVLTILSFFALVAGLIGFHGGWDEPLTVKTRGLAFTFHRALDYFIPVGIVLFISTAVSVAILVAGVTGKAAKG